MLHDGEDHGDVPARTDGTRPNHLRQSRQPRRAGVIDVDALRFTREVSASDEQPFIDHDKRLPHGVHVRASRLQR